MLAPHTKSTAPTRCKSRPCPAASELELSRCSARARVPSPAFSQMEGRDEAIGRDGGAFPRIWPMAAGVDELQRLGEDLVATSIARGLERQGVDGGPSASGVRPRWRRGAVPGAELQGCPAVVLERPVSEWTRPRGGARIAPSRKRPDVRRLARRQPGPADEPCGRGAGAEARRHEGLDAGPVLRPRRGSSSTRSTPTPSPGSGTWRSPESANTMSSAVRGADRGSLATGEPRRRC